MLASLPPHAAITSASASTTATSSRDRRPTRFDGQRAGPRVPPIRTTLPIAHPPDALPMTTDRAVVDDPRAGAGARRAARGAGRLVRQRLTDLVHRRGADPRVAAPPGRRVPAARRGLALRPLGAASSTSSPRATPPTRSTSAGTRSPRRAVGRARVLPRLRRRPRARDALRPRRELLGIRAGPLRSRRPRQVADAWEAQRRGLDRPLLGDQLQA